MRCTGITISRAQKGLLALLVLAPLPSVSAEDACTLCQDGSPPPNPDMMLIMAKDDGLDWSCGGMDEVARADTAVLETGYGSCGKYHLYGHLCGCDNTPPEDACNHCNIDMPDPDRITNPGPEVVLQGGLWTCAVEYLHTMYTSTEGDPMCETHKAYTGVYCGCQTKPPEPVCNLCPGEDEFVNIELVDPAATEATASLPKEMLRTTCYNANYYYEYFARIGLDDDAKCQENLDAIISDYGPDYCCSPLSNYYANTTDDSDGDHGDDVDTLDTTSSSNKRGLAATLIITPSLWLSLLSA